MGCESCILYPAHKIPRCQPQRRDTHVENSRWEMINLVNYLPCVLGLSDDSFRRRGAAPQQNVSFPFAVQWTRFLFRCLSSGGCLSSHVPPKNSILADRKVFDRRPHGGAWGRESKEQPPEASPPSVLWLITPDWGFFRPRFRFSLSQVRRDIKNAGEHLLNNFLHIRPC